MKKTNEENKGSEAWRRRLHFVWIAAGSLAITAALFLLIPLMNRSSYRRPEPKRYSRLHWFEARKSPQRPPTSRSPSRAVQTPPPAPPKPPPPQPRFARPAPPAARVDAPVSPLRLDPFSLASAGLGEIPLYLPDEPARPAEGGAGDGEVRPAEPEKDLYLPHEIDGPPKVIRRNVPLYPPEALRRYIEGFAVLRFIVDQDGAVRDIETVDWSGSRKFAESATRALRSWTFSPGTRRGKPVRVRCKLRFNFREED